jgi:hypothetical protein
MSLSTPIAPITFPSASRSAEALREVGMTSPVARAVEARVRVTPLRPLRAGGGELAGLFADEARERLLDDLVPAEAEEFGDRVVGLEDLALEVGDEHRVGRVLDQALRVRARLVQLAHVAEHADRPDHAPVPVAQSGGIEGGGDDLARRGPRVEDGVSGDAALDDLA